MDNLSAARRAAYDVAMAELSPSGSDMPGRMIATLRSLLPKRFRSDIPVVPVVRLTGVIGFSTPLKPGLTLAGVARALDRAFGRARQARSRC